MPINYQAPSPPIGAYMSAASNFNPGAAAALIGREEELGVNQGLQIALANQHGSQQAEIESARNQATAQAQERHAQLQVWVNGQEMTQAEQMQLRQDQNAIAWINGQRGKTLTNQEADDAIAQRMARVNLGQQRLQAQQLKLQQEQTQRVAAQTKVQNAVYDSMTSAADSKRAIVIDKDFRVQAEQYARTVGLDPASPEGRAEMEAYATQAGKVVTGWTQKDGTIKPDPAPKATGARAGATGAESEHQYLLHHESATKATERWAKAQETPPSEQAQEQHYQKEMDRLEAARQKYRAQTPEGQRAAKAEEHKTALGKLQVDAEQIRDQPNLDPGQKQAATTILGIQKHLMETYGPYDQMRPMLKKKMDTLALQLKAIRMSQAPQIQTVPTASDGYTARE